MESPEVQTRRPQRRLDSRSPTEGSTKCERAELQLLFPDQIVACSDTNDTHADGLRTSSAQLLYGTPTSSNPSGGEVEKCGETKTKRGSSEVLKWGVKKVRKGPVSPKAFEGNSLITPANEDPEQHPVRKVPKQRRTQTPCSTPPLNSKGKSSTPKMIRNESTPMVARMETWSKTSPQVPAGPVTPVPDRQKRPQKRKSLHALSDVHRPHGNLGSAQECMMEPKSPATARMLDTDSGEIKVVIPLRRELFNTEQTVLATPAAAIQSPAASEKFQVQAGEWACPNLESGHDGNQIEWAVADCDPLLGRNGLSANRGEYGTGYPNGVHIVEDAFKQQHSDEYLEGVISEFDPSTPVKFSIAKKPRGNLKVQMRTEQEFLYSDDEDILSAGCGSEGAALKSADFFPALSSRRKKQNSSIDLNKPPSPSSDEPPVCLAEKPPDPNEKISRKKHPRPRVLKDVTKPVRVPKPEKASTARKAQSTKPKRTKNTDSQDAEMGQQNVYPGSGSYEEQAEMGVPEPLQREDSLESICKPWRMRAAARLRKSSRLSVQTLEGESIRAIHGVAMGLADLKLTDEASTAIVLHCSAQRAIVPYARPRLKPFKPKVQLGADDLQWWKLVMAHGPCYEDKSDEATAEKWAKERFVFKLRPDKFIQVMHEVQGNRRFSKWMGSVIDSVVGAFLTQNVSDHLSSSAFMLLAARFPVSASSRENIFTEVRVEETFEPEESYTVATPLRTRHADHKDYVVEEPTTTTTDVPYTVEEPSVAGVPSTVEELEKEHIEFWDPLRSIQNGQTHMESQDQIDHTSCTEVQDTSPGKFKIRDDLEDENPVESSVPQDVEDNNSSIRDAPEECRVESPLIDHLQSTVAVQLPSDSVSSVEEKVKISYIGLTGSERAKLEQNKTKSKDKVDWEEVRKSFAEQSSNGASQSLVEDAVDWGAVRDIDVDQIASVIKERGMNNMLAGRIKGHARQQSLEAPTIAPLTSFFPCGAQAEYEMERASSRRLMNTEDEFKLNGPRHHRSYSRGLNKLITIGGRGPEFLLRRASMVSPHTTEDSCYQREGDTVDQAEWRCFRTVNGLRIFEDVAASKAEKGTIMKSVGVVDAAPDTIFEMVMSLEKSLRYEWDVLTADLELVEQLDGHSDIVYGTFDPKYFKRWHAKRDFVFSRYWRRDQDGSYLIHQISTIHKTKPVRHGYQRIDFNPGIWEITPLPARPGANAPRSLVTQIMEVKSTGWGRWKASHYAKFHKTVPCVMLCRIAGLREFFAAKPELSMTPEAAERVKMGTSPKAGRKSSDSPDSPPESLVQVPESNEEFYDAIMGAEPADDTEGGDSEEDESKSAHKTPGHSHRFRALSWSVMMGLPSKRPPAREENGELVLSALPVTINASASKGTLRRSVYDKDSDCWSEPGGKGFMVRGRTYNDDGLKVPGTDPLLKLMAVDWMYSEERVDFVAKNSNSIVQSAAGKTAPFILVVNLQVPAKPNYSMVFYYVADRPVRKGSLLDQFVNGDDAYRNARFKLIPSIVEGYWMVKRAVGTKACLLGRAVTCRYLREDNFLEIDVDIGSSSVARGVIGLVLGYVTSLVVDLGILIEAKEECELPEYVLGAVRINRIRVESAVPFTGT